MALVLLGIANVLGDHGGFRLGDWPSARIRFAGRSSRRDLRIGDLYVELREGGVSNRVTITDRNLPTHIHVSRPSQWHYFGGQDTVFGAYCLLHFKIPLLDPTFQGREFALGVGEAHVVPYPACQ